MSLDLDLNLSIAVIPNNDRYHTFLLQPTMSIQNGKIASDMKSLTPKTDQAISQ